MKQPYLGSIPLLDVLCQELRVRRNAAPCVYTSFAHGGELKWVVHFSDPPASRDSDG